MALKVVHEGVGHTEKLRTGKPVERTLFDVLSWQWLGPVQLTTVVPTRNPDVRRAKNAGASTSRRCAPFVARGARIAGRDGRPTMRTVALYEAEGRTRVGELHLPLDEDTVLDLWVYVSPERQRSARRASAACAGPPGAAR
jgi:hypothetical protein